MNIGFIGTGIMGKPMAYNLQQAGHPLYFSAHFEPAPQELIGERGIVCSTPREVAQECEIIITMLPDTPHVEDVLFHPHYGVIHGLSQGKVVIDMSSISPVATKAFAQRIIAAGAEYIDAPVSGGEVGAKAGTLSIMVGGREEVYLQIKPILELMGKNITLVGNAGDGQTCKVANQIIVALNIEAVAEALLFASKSGADPARVREALMGGFASSRVLEVHGERMIKGTFEPGFRISLHQKDLNLALENARLLNTPLPNTALTQQLFSACAALGGKEWDHSALIRALETQANYTIRK
ncbi:2-hydroxy-3-oxopropionate reductase [Escherichia marmotae]|uniref:2-hydroxy-3-oxopropionate reductase n=1 Tax=Escherichia marmotae TaxID=1499973 RepID=UPI001C9A8A1E|nr:2-hydroxy-3-oxopropionate reductase [Escherichia marmotae]MBY7303883.1 2-hydroxy-3-oxopropionate reductase [Escherichia marmotae]